LKLYKVREKKFGKFARINKKLMNWLSLICKENVPVIGNNM
jgi:hypothetical protein